MISQKQPRRELQYI